MAHEIRSEFEATVNELHYKDRDVVKEGALIITLTCMKMLMPIYAPADGLVNYFVDADNYVREGDLLAIIGTVTKGAA